MPVPSAVFDIRPGNPLSLIHHPGTWFGGNGVQVHLVVESLKCPSSSHLNLWFKGMTFNGTCGRCPLFPPLPA